MGQNDEKTAKLWELIRDIEVAMMVTEDGPNLRARPMWTANRTFEDGTIWFFTSADSHKIAELGAEQRVNLSYASPDDQEFVSLSGRAGIVRDRTKMGDLWRETMKTWFPGGLDDPNMALIKVDVTEAEYWDTPSSTMVHAYGYVKATLTGKPPSPGENEKLRL